MRWDDRFFALLGMTVMLAALCSCSVKEDRSDCPCWLTVEAEKSISISGWFGQTNLFRDHAGGFVERTVPRGTVDITGVHGSLVAPVGHQLDSLFAAHVSVNTVAEFRHTKVALRKNFATVELDFKDEDDGRTEYELEVTGTVCGADARTLEPKEGHFRCIPEPQAAKRGYAFRVPRQKDESLRLILSREGTVRETIDLGRIIVKNGFDWTKEDLGDITVLCDLPAHTFTISIKDWEGPVTFEITI